VGRGGDDSPVELWWPAESLVVGGGQTRPGKAERGSGVVVIVVGGHEREMSGGQPLAAYIGEGERERREEVGAGSSWWQEPRGGGDGACITAPGGVGAGERKSGRGRERRLTCGSAGGGAAGRDTGSD
jgi:hypothetical protein